MGYALTKDADHSFSVVSSDIKAYYAALIRRVPKDSVISVSTDGTRSAVIQQEPVVSSNRDAVTDLRSLRDALVARLAH